MPLECALVTANEFAAAPRLWLQITPSLFPLSLRRPLAPFGSSRRRLCNSAPQCRTTWQSRPRRRDSKCVEVRTALHSHLSERLLLARSERPSFVTPSRSDRQRHRSRRKPYTRLPRHPVPET